MFGEASAERCDAVPAFKDLFSAGARAYARHRPGYPGKLFEFLAGLVPRRELAWDCGCGNGQASLGLAQHFDAVIATDASPQQLAHAAPHPRVTYRCALAEKPGLAAGSVDLVTVAQALHWFPNAAFFNRVRAVARPHGVFAAWCYALPTVNERVDAVCRWFYADVTGPFWEAGRNWVDDRYETIPFPFAEIPGPGPLACTAVWTLDQYAGFIGSWSAVQKYARHHGRSPLERLAAPLAEAWGPPEVARTVTWPLHVRIGRCQAVAG